MNRLVWHAFVCSPDETGIPGQQYFAGTHLNPKVTWWDKSAPFFSYIDRCQFLLQQGLFVADACYYYGDHVPNFSQLKRSDPAHCEPGYDYDVITAEALIERASVRDWQDCPARRHELSRAGVAGSRRDFAARAEENPGSSSPPAPRSSAPNPRAAKRWRILPPPTRKCKKSPVNCGAATLGKGRVITGKTAREVLQSDGVPPDCEFASNFGAQLITNYNIWVHPSFDYIHRTTGDAEIYFVANRTNLAAKRHVSLFACVARRRNYGTQ